MTGQAGSPGDGNQPGLSRRITFILVDRFARKQSALSPRRWYPGMTCAICGETVHQWQLFNFDHEIPMGKGGARGRRNKHYTHLLCNTVKGDRYPFSLRTTAEREAVRPRLRPATYQRLLSTWAGEV